MSQTMFALKPHYNIKTRSSVKNIMDGKTIILHSDVCSKIQEKLEWCRLMRWKEYPSDEWTQIKYEKVTEIYNLIIDEIPYLGRSQRFLRTIIDKIYELTSYEDFNRNQRETLLGYVDILRIYLQE